MHERFYTTAELARICGVSISTIKRWTDSGLLRCLRTPGGHRKFRLQDVAEAARQLGSSMAVPEARPAAEVDALSLLLLQQDQEGLVTRLAATLGQGDGPAVCRWLVDLHRHGLGVQKIAGEILLGALDAVLAQAGDDFVQRRALRLTEAAARQLSLQLPPPLPSGPRALLAGGPGEDGTLWLALAALALADEGWERVDLGPGVPVSTIRAGIGVVRPRLVVIAGALVPEAAALQRDCAAAGAGLCLLPGTEAPSAALAALQRQARSQATPAAATLEYARGRHGFP